ncbi:MAG: Gfo/Idh/MocA family oxidoreductase [Victivallales bacterium]|jgi:predicted dehydrogenase|nr:Gfo/Idh/MocA family oxidoreductase [Victivallales bacterium]
MKTLALVGCGHIHTPNFVQRMAARQDIKVAKVWDHNADRAKVTADKLGAAVAEFPKDIWNDAAIDAVVICSETNRHEELVLQAVAAKKHLYVEKPLGYSAADAWKMAHAIEKEGLIFQTGYFMRGQSIHMFLKQQVANGAFGKISRIRHVNCHSGSLGGWFDKEWRWMADPAIAGCGAFGDLGTHSLDILLWLIDQVPEAATASIKTVTNRYPGCDETGEGIISFPDGTIATVAAGWVDIDQPVQLEISGTEGFAAVINGQLFFTSKHVAGADGKKPWTELPAQLPHAFELFLDAVNGKKVPLVSAKEAALRSAVMEAMYKGAKSGVWVKPEVL